jgi:hypothetical protein
MCLRGLRSAFQGVICDLCPVELLFVDISTLKDDNANEAVEVLERPASRQTQ